MMLIIDSNYSLLSSFVKKNNSYLSIPEKHIKTYEKLKKKYEIITINKLEEYKNELDDKQILPI